MPSSRLALLVGTAAMVAGCGSSSNGTNADSTRAATSHSSPAPTGPAFPKAAAKQAAQAALLTINDFPSGWSTSKHQNNDSPADRKAQQQFAACVHAPPGLFHDSNDPDSTSVDSPDFNDPEGNATVQETVGVGTTSKVDAVFNTLKKPEATDCVASLLNTEVKIAAASDAQSANITVGQPEVGQISFPRMGDDVVTIRAKIPLQAEGLNVDVYGDLIFVRHGNSAVEMSFENPESPFGSADEQKYCRLALARLVAAKVPTA